MPLEWHDQLQLPGDVAGSIHRRNGHPRLRSMRSALKGPCRSSPQPMKMSFCWMQTLRPLWLSSSTKGAGPRAEPFWFPSYLPCGAGGHCSWVERSASPEACALRGVRSQQQSREGWDAGIESTRGMYVGALYHFSLQVGELDFRHQIHQMSAGSRPWC